MGEASAYRRGETIFENGKAKKIARKLKSDYIFQNKNQQYEVDTTDDSDIFDAYGNIILKDDASEESVNEAYVNAPVFVEQALFYVSASDCTFNKLNIMSGIRAGKAASFYILGN